MKIHRPSDQFAIADDFLAPEDFEMLWRWFQTAPFINNDFRGFHGSWRLDDGRVMRGQDVYYGPVAEQFAKATPGSVPFPTGTGIDLLIKQFVRHCTEFSDLIGNEGRDWRTLAAAPRLYERGSSLYWHRDSPSVVTGSCTFYGHPEWNVQWGGELFIAEPSTRAIPEDHGPSMRKPLDVMGQGLTQLSGHLDNREVNARLLETGFGHYVAAKPNRLVVMRTGNPHMISKVQAAAGDRVRASVTMFLIRPGQERADGMR